VKKAAILIRKAPYGSIYPVEGYRAIMGLKLFEVDVYVLFVDDGVYTLVKGQNPGKLDMKPLGEAFPMLEDFEVNRFCVHDASLAERGLTKDDLVIPVEVVDSARFAALLNECGTVLPF
jgi:tRNA 2-thiouridine synthesizing protein C